MEWAQEHVRYTGAQWNSVVLFDEKKFNLDGTDCFSYYWRDLRNERRVQMSRQLEGGFVMVWGAFSLLGQSKIAKISGKQTVEL